MGPVPVKFIASVSSEAAGRPATSVLSTNVATHWLAAAAENPTLVLQLERAVELEQVTIGNYGAGMIEVFGRSSVATRSDWTRVIGATTLMTKDNDKAQTVEIIRKDRILPEAFGKRFDQLKLQLTLPHWDQRGAAGLTFITVEEPAQPGPTAKLGGFQMRTMTKRKSMLDTLFEQTKTNKGETASGSMQPETPVQAMHVPVLSATHHNSSLAQKIVASIRRDAEETRGDVIENRDQGRLHRNLNKDCTATKNTTKTSSPPSNATAAARRLPASIIPASNTASRARTPSPDNDTLSEYEQQRQKTIAENKKKLQQLGLPTGDTPPRKILKPKLPTNAKPTAPTRQSKRVRDTGSSDRQSKRRRGDGDSKAEVSTGKKVPFRNIMRGVVFVLSGYQNPIRSEIREKAIKMGAWYEREWNQKATHLVCAFKNTPKYHEVRAKGGIIVSHKWIEQQHSRRVQLKASAYTLEDASGTDDEEDDDAEDDGDDIDDDEDIETADEAAHDEWDAADDDDEYVPPGAVAGNSADESDTASESEQVAQILAKRNSAVGGQRDADVFGAETDDD